MQQNWIIKRLDKFLAKQYSEVEIEDVQQKHAADKRLVQGDESVLIWTEDGFFKIIKYSNPEYLIPTSLCKFKKLPNGVNQVYSVWESTKEEGKVVFALIHNSNGEHSIYQITTHEVRKIVSSKHILLK